MYRNSTQLEKDDENEPVAQEDLSSVEIDEILDTLTETERQVIVLSYICGFTSDEISLITNLNPNTVRSHILRGKNKLRQHYPLQSL